jgi:hypothetical protein
VDLSDERVSDNFEHRTRPLTLAGKLKVKMTAAMHRMLGCRRDQLGKAK